MRFTESARNCTEKAAIVTMYGDINYGNRLQNFAMQELLREKGFEVDTLQCIVAPLKELLRQAYLYLLTATGSQSAKRRIRLRHFNEEHIHTRKVYSRNGRFSESLAKEYTWFVVGSDQVWNPEIRYKDRYNFFLRFAELGQRICISPSIGVSVLPAYCRAEYAEYMKEFRYLSCREVDGAREIEALCGKKCEHILDPTMAISADKWRKLSTPLPVNQKFVLVFFLGSIGEQATGNITAFARANGYLIMEISDEKSPWFALSPEELIWAIDHAQMVFTDSFHVTAFSINLKTPFYAFERHETGESAGNHMASRLRSLIELFSLRSRFAATKLPTFSEVCDFSQIDAVFAQERAKFARYIDRCFAKEGKIR